MSAAIRLKQLANEAGKVCESSEGLAQLLPQNSSTQTIQERFSFFCQGEEFRVCVIEKSATVGGHIVSGACIEPSALNELIPDWKEKEGHPLKTPVTADKFALLTATGRIPVPIIK